MRIQDLALRLLGSSSGETIVRAAAAASGAITLPAGTTDFSATGGASQVVRQSSAGGAFTVGQLAAADVSGALTGNQTIILSGDISGSGATAIATTLPTVNGNVGTFQGLTVNAKGQVTAAANQSYATGLGAATPGTSGGIPYYNSTTTLASSALLTANALVKGGGAGAAPVASTATVDGSGNLGATGNITGKAILSTTATAGFNFEDNATPGTNSWSLYATGGTARLWRGVDKLTLDGSGNLTMVGGLVGTATNNNATAGNVGEYVSSNITTPLNLTASTATNLATISLTAGDWDVSGAVCFTPAGATVVTRTYAALSATSLDLTQSNLATCSFSNHQITYAAGTVDPTEIPAPLRLSLASTTTVYLVVYCSFTTSTCTAIGIIRARRVR